MVEPGVVLEADIWMAPFPRHVSSLLVTVKLKSKTEALEM